MYKTQALGFTMYRIFMSPVYLSMSDKMDSDVKIFHLKRITEYLIIAEKKEASYKTEGYSAGMHFHVGCGLGSVNGSSTGTTK